MKNPPSAYLEKLRSVLDHGGGRKVRGHCSYVTAGQDSDWAWQHFCSDGIRGLKENAQLPFIFFIF